MPKPSFRRTIVRLFKPKLGTNTFLMSINLKVIMRLRVELPY